MYEPPPFLSVFGDFRRETALKTWSNVINNDGHPSSTPSDSLTGQWISASHGSFATRIFQWFQWSELWPPKSFMWNAMIYACFLTLPSICTEFRLDDLWLHSISGENYQQIIHHDPIGHNLSFATLGHITTVQLKRTTAKACHQIWSGCANTGNLWRWKTLTRFRIIRDTQSKNMTSPYVKILIKVNSKPLWTFNIGTYFWESLSPTGWLYLT